MDSFDPSTFNPPIPFPKNPPYKIQAKVFEWTLKEYYWRVLYQFGGQVENRDEAEAIVSKTANLDAKNYLID
jgi:hypothetical protein